MKQVLMGETPCNRLWEWALKNLKDNRLSERMILITTYLSNHKVTARQKIMKDRRNNSNSSTSWIF